MRKSEVFLSLSLSFIFGVLWGSFFNLEKSSVCMLLIVWIIFWIIFWRDKKIIIISFSILFLLSGWARMDNSITEINIKRDLNSFSGSAEIAKIPELKEDYQKIIVKAQINGESEKILINTDLLEEYDYGDEVQLNCRLEKPKNFSENFDYKMYLAKDGIAYLCKNAQIEKTGENNGFFVYKWILGMRSKMENVMNSLIPQPEAALASGLLFGGSNRLSENSQEQFSRTGMTHIVAVSGYNVTIIAEYLIFLGIVVGFWRNQAFWFALVGIFLFVALIGFPASAIRAGFMGTLLLWAIKNGRLANSYSALVFAGGIMLLLNPLILRYDIGFQLSFLATAGIIFFSPLWEPYFSSKMNALGILEIILLTLSAQIFVLPIILFNFGYLSIVSILANVLVLPVIPISMLLSFLVVSLGIFNQLLVIPFAWVNYLVLRYETSVIEFLSSLSWAGINIDFSLNLLILWYVLLTGFLFWAYRNKTKINEK